MNARYAWSTRYSYNCFGADEHYEVTLYKLNSKGTKWKAVQSWSYSTFLKSKLAHSLAERRISKLRNIYQAEAV